MSTTPPALAVSLLLLLLFLLLLQAQGIRLEKGFISVKQQNKNIHEDGTVLTKKSESTAASGVLRKDCGHDDHCSSSGNSRKLITVRSSTTTSKNEKNIVGKQIGNQKAELSSATSSNKNHAKEEEEVATTRQQYPDLIDLTEMDYSPARRKPPIHN